MVSIWTWNVNSIRKKVDLVNNLLTKYKIDILVVTETKIKPKDESSLEFNKEYDVIYNSNTNSCWHGICIIYKRNLFNKVKVLYRHLPNVTTKNPKIKEPASTKEPTSTKESENCDIIEGTDDHSDNIEKGHNTEGRILVVKYRLHSPCKDEDNKSKKEETFVVVGTYVPNSGVNRKDPLKRLAYRVQVWDHDLFHLLNNLQKKYGKVVWTGDMNVVRYNNDVFNSKINIFRSNIF